MIEGLPDDLLTSFQIPPKSEFPAEFQDFIITTKGQLGPVKPLVQEGSKILYKKGAATDCKAGRKVLQNEERCFPAETWRHGAARHEGVLCDRMH